MLEVMLIPHDLQADVVAISGHTEFQDRLRDDEARSTLDLSKLEAGWRSLSARDRFVMRRLYGLDGHPAWKQAEVARFLGCASATVVRARERVLRVLREALYDPFYGLDKRARNQLRWADITHPEQLPEHVNTVLRRRLWGPENFQALEAWMAAAGYPSLIPHLDATSRRRVGLR